MPGEPTLPSLADIDAVLAHLPALERPADGRHPPWFGAPPAVARLQDALARHGFVIGFDWPAWRPEADRYHDDHALLARASLLDVCKLLTLHVRADRFIGGHFVGAVESGLIAAILRRLRAIRDELAA
jgi:hypothetical protein